MESASAVAGSDPVLATTGRVLVVDGDPDISALIAFKLEQAGYEVATAADGADALAVTEYWQPDLVVLDVALPGMTGYDVCRRFRADPAMEDVPIIMLTARTHATYSTLGYMAGADLYLTKPFSPRELVERVEGMLARPRERFGEELRGDIVGIAMAQSEHPAPTRTPRWWRR